MQSLSSLRNALKIPAGSATVVDSSARDGLQSSASLLSPAARAQWLRHLLSAGVPELEAGSFVHPGRVPQMARSDEVLALLSEYRDRLWVLVPNARGLDQAIAAGARNVVCLASATETHSRANLGRPIEDVVGDLTRMARRAEQSDLRARVSISMAWVDPEEGPVPPSQVVRICRELVDAGYREFTLCDTYGAACPNAVIDLIESLSPLLPPERLGLHLHDTFGAASANTWAGLLAGVRRHEGAVLGLGGCPFVPAARGNVDTRHLVRLLHCCGATTGIDEMELASAASRCQELMAAAMPSPPH